MHRAVRHALTGSFLAMLLAAPAAHADWVVTPPRTGQLGIALQGEFGSFLKSGNLGDTFDNGPGLAVRLRYRMRYERALGVSFEGQRFGVRELADSSTAVHHLSVFSVGGDIYQMFGTRTHTTKWIGAGAGLVQFRRTLRDKEVDFGTDTDGVYVDAAAGLERFVWHTWALDLSGKYFAVFENGHVNHDLQASLGIIVYATY